MNVPSGLEGSSIPRQNPLAQLLSSNCMHIMICFIGGLSCLLPLFIHPVSLLEDTCLRAALPSMRNRDSAVAAVALIVPVIMEMTTDIVICCFETADRIKYNCRDALLNSPEKFVFFCGTVIVPITAFLPTDTENWAYIYLCCTKCQLMMVGGAVVTSLCRYDKKYWSERSTYLFLLLLTMGTVTGAFTDNQTAQAVKSSNDRIRYASYCLVTTATGLFFFCSGRWLKLVIPKLFSALFTLHPSKSNECKTLQGTAHSNYDVVHLIFPVMYISTSIAACGLLTIIAILYPGISMFDADALFYHNLAYIVFLLFIMYTSIRMMRQQVVNGLVSTSQHSTCLIIQYSLIELPFLSVQRDIFTQQCPLLFGI